MREILVSRRVLYVIRKIFPCMDIREGHARSRRIRRLFAPSTHGLPSLDDLPSIHGRGVCWALWWHCRLRSGASVSSCGTDGSAGIVCFFGVLIIFCKEYPYQCIIPLQGMRFWLWVPFCYNGFSPPTKLVISLIINWDTI